MANIHRSRKSGLVIRGGQSRRDTAWAAIIETSNGLASANTAVLFGGFSGAALALRPFTIVRTRVNWLVRSDQLSATEMYMVALGISIVSSQALAIGVTAVPTPFTDLDSDLFFLHDIITGEQLVTTAVGINMAMPNKDVDSRAMRKVEDGQDVAIVIENSSIGLGSTVRKSGRVLLKLH